MPKLGTVQTTRIDLPSGTPDDPAWCEVKTELLLGDMAIAMGDDDENNISKAIAMLSLLITAWNFTDENGDPVEPTAEWIAKLTAPDFAHLSTWVKENIIDKQEALTNSEKKASSSPSTVTTPPTSQPII